jgi:3-deoxy-7-phosphoheptulonate synthase
MDCTTDLIEKKLRIMLQMSLVLTWGARMPTVRVARMAGQFAKPRSKPTEIVNGTEVRMKYNHRTQPTITINFPNKMKQVLSFRGDLINGFDSNDRIPDPNRLVLG